MLSVLGEQRLPLLVFATAYDQHALEAFEVNAMDSTIILKTTGRVSYALTTFIPFAFLFVTTLVASYYNVTLVYLPQHMTLNVILSITMAVLALVIVVDALLKWSRLIADKKRLENQRIRHEAIVQELTAK